MKDEELRLERGISRTVATLDGVLPGSYFLTVVDNGSSDRTSAVADGLCERYSQVRYLRIEERGVGAAFRAGIAENDCPLVGYMDVDLATDPRYVADVVSIFSGGRAEMVNGSRWACPGSNEGRPLVRRATSAGLVFVLRAMFGMRATDAVCGFKFFRREVADALVEAAGDSCDGWPYIVELLVRAERGGVRIVELPVEWRDDGRSSVRVFPQTAEYVVELAKLRRRLGGGR